MHVDFMQPLRPARRDFERDYFLFHLHRLDGDVSATACYVGTSREYLARKLKILGIERRRHPGGRHYLVKKGE